MLHTVGAILIFGGSAWVGWHAGHSLSVRTQRLRELVNALKHMQQELSFRLTPLPELLTHVGGTLEQPLGTFFICCGQAAQSGDGRFAANWRQEVDRLQGYLEPQVVDCLLRLGQEIGQYNWEEEGKFLSFTIKELESYLESARQENTRLGQLYRTLGITAGAFLVILLL